MSANYEAVLRRYMEALGARDYATIKSLFAEDGTDKVGALTLIYDTHLIWQTAGNKYES